MQLAKEVGMEDFYVTYAAVAEKISTILPLVNIPSPIEKLTVNMPMTTNRVVMLLIRYKTTIEPTGTSEARAVPITAPSRVILSWEYCTVLLYISDGSGVYLRLSNSR